MTIIEFDGWILEIEEKVEKVQGFMMAAGAITGAALTLPLILLVLILKKWRQW